MSTVTPATESQRLRLSEGETKAVHPEIDDVAIEAQNLNVYYGDFQAVKDINLRIERQKNRAALIQPHERSRADCEN